METPAIVNSTAPKKGHGKMFVFDAKRIEKQNAAFHKMSNKKQRMAIAKDVLAQLKLKKYVASPGHYVYSSKLNELENLHNTANYRADDMVQAFDFQKALLVNAPECNVCGLGAAFCSMARLGDDLTTDDANDIHEVLSPIFGRTQVALIEYAFEGWDVNGDASENLTDHQMDKCTHFYGKHSNDDKRLGAIFKNVIKNNGKFKP